MAEKPAKEKKKKEKKKKQKKGKSSYYSAKEGGVSRSKKACPKCGGGVFMAEHKNRLSCGKCSYTEYKQGDA